MIADKGIASAVTRRTRDGTNTLFLSERCHADSRAIFMLMLLPMSRCCRYALHTLHYACFDALRYAMMLTMRDARADILPPPYATFDADNTR